MFETLFTYLDVHMGFLPILYKKLWKEENKMKNSVKRKQKIEKPKYEKKSRFAACCVCPGSESACASGISTAFCSAVNIAV